MKNKVVPIQTATAKPTPPAPQLPETGFLRLNQILGDKDHPPIIPVGKTTWYAWVKSGRVPKGKLLGTKTRVYRVEDIRALVEELGAV